MLALVLSVSAVLAIVDQIIKYFVLRDLAPIGKLSVIDNLFSLIYVENRGVAFGLFQNMVWIFSIFTGILIGVFVYLITKKKFTGKMFYISSMLIIGGGIGNFIDRVFRGYVIDYLSLSFFPPVCNFADYCVTIGAILFVIMIFMNYRETENKPKLQGDSNE